MNVLLATIWTLVVALAPPASSRDRLEAQIESELPADLALVELQPSGRLPRGEALAVQWDRPPRKGQMWIRVRGAEKSALVRIVLARRHAVVVSRVDLPVGSVVRPADVKIEHRVGGEGLELLPAAMAGAKVVRAVRAGEVVAAKDVTLPPPVERGAEVTVRVSAGGIDVRTRGKLERSARPGEAVTVRVGATHHVLHGTLTDRSTVSVDSTGGTP